MASAQLNAGERLRATSDPSHGGVGSPCGLSVGSVSATDDLTRGPEAATIGLATVESHRTPDLALRLRLPRGGASGVRDR